MLHVCYSRFDHRFPEDVADRLAATISFDPTFLPNKFCRWQDAQAHLIGRLLLAKGLLALGVPDIPPLRYSDYHRPYVDLPLDFSISHSGEYVLCALADTLRVGVDIEKIRPIELADMEGSFSPQEWREITTATDANRQLFDHWTRKEAVAKADGRGMHVADRIVLSGLQASVDDTAWALHELVLVPDYCSYLASSDVIRTPIHCARVEFP